MATQIFRIHVVELKKKSSGVKSSDVSKNASEVLLEGTKGDADHAGPDSLHISAVAGDKSWSQTLSVKATMLTRLWSAWFK